MDRRSFLIDQHANSQEAIALGLNWLRENSVDDSGVIALLQKVHVRNAFEDIVGQARVKNLERRGFINLSTRGGPTVKANFMFSTVRGGHFKGATLVIWPTPKFLNKIDANRDLNPVCVIPWMESDVVDWKRAWNPTIIGSTVSNEPATKPQIDPLVKEALRSLSANTSTGIAHPSDKNSAVHVFRILKKHGIAVDPDEVRAQLVREGWKPSHADDVRDLAQRVLEGRQIRGVKASRFPTNILEIWRERAAEAES